MRRERSRKRKSRSSVKLFPLYKHPQDALPQENPPQCQCIVGRFFACSGAWGLCPQQAFFACVITQALLAGSKALRWRGKGPELCNNSSTLPAPVLRKLLALVFDFRKLSRRRHDNPQAAFAHAIQQCVKLPTLCTFPSTLVWEKELVY